MPIKEVSYGGWSRNLRLANDSVELIVSLEVGPRILSYRPLEGKNMLHNYPTQMGKTGENEWMNRGGHRLWIAPEDPILSYALDNQTYPFEICGESSIRLTNTGDSARAIRKEIHLELAITGSDVRLTHTLTNESAISHSVAPWALSVMAPGGISILPQPAPGQHPQDLLPDRVLVLWPYSDTSDPRFKVGKHFITLRQETTGSAFKYGLAHRGKWAAYLLGDQLFIKTVAFIAGANYPDFGCNYESFTNGDMLEIETIGPLVNLAPGETISHLENWRIFEGINPPPYSDSAAFADWIKPYLP